MKKIMFLALILVSATLTDAILVGVFVEFPNGETKKICLDTEEGENAYSILEKTGLGIEWSYHSTWGHGLCKIEDFGCPAEDCWCTDKYWGFYVKEYEEESWKYSPVGFDGGTSCREHYCAREGDIIGLIYSTYGTKPREILFNEVCGIKRKEYVRWFNATISPDRPQSGENITIEVKDGYNKPIASASVEVYDGIAGISKKIYSGKTGPEGKLNLILPAGDYKIRINAREYKPPQKQLSIEVREKEKQTTTTQTSTTTTSIATTTTTAKSTTTTITTTTTTTTSTNTTKTLNTKQPEATANVIKIENSIMLTALIFFVLVSSYFLIKKKA